MEKKVVIKWNKDYFNVDIKKENTVKDLKNAIYEMTGINIKDQKLIKSGSILNENDSIKYYEDSCVITLITANNFSSNLLKDDKPNITREIKTDIEQPINGDIGYNYSEIGERMGSREEIVGNSWTKKICTKINTILMAAICCTFMGVVILILIKK